MKKQSCAILAFVVSILFSGRTMAQMSPAGQRAYRNAVIAMDNVKKNPELFDGVQLTPNARLDRCASYLKSSFENLNRAIDAYKSIPPEDKKNQDVQKLALQMADMQKYLRAMAQQVIELEQKMKNADNQCRAFQNEAMSPPRRSVMVQLVTAMENPENFELYTPDDVKMYMAAAQEIKTICAKPEYRDVGKEGCSWLKIGGNRENPAAWCEASGKALDLIRQAVLRAIRKNIEREASLLPTPEKLMQNDGFLGAPQFEGPITFKDRLVFGDFYRQRAREQFRELLSLLQIAEIPEAFFEPYIKALDALRAAVEKTADNWKLPAPKPDTYGVSLARQQVVKWYQEQSKISAAVKKAFMSTDSWEIEKNELGVPLNRYQGGFVVLQVPGEKYCQVRSFTLREEYAGSGKYQKASGVRFGFPRFQKCP